MHLSNVVTLMPNGIQVDKTILTSVIGSLSRILTGINIVDITAPTGYFEIVFDDNEFESVKEALHVVSVAHDVALKSYVIGKSPVDLTIRMAFYKGYSIELPQGMSFSELVKTEPSEWNAIALTRYGKQ